MFRRARRRTVKPVFMTFTRNAYAAATEVAIRAVQRRAGRAADRVQSGPLVVVGFFGEPSGVGRAADLSLQALRRLGLAPFAVDARKLLAGDHSEIERCGHGGVILIHCNPDEGIRILARMPARFWIDRKRIGYWAWELPKAPARWRRAATLFHEVWVPSRFVADAVLSAGTRTNVRVMPHLVTRAGDCPPDRQKWRFPPESTVVLSMADFRSSATRKNLTGSIDICRRAATPQRPIVLVIKALRAPRDELYSLAQVRSEFLDLKLMTEPIAATEIQSLIASVDILLSPHRSEGFGLALAEALLAGTPVLATGWSGNMEFMEGLADMLIHHRLVRVQDKAGIYRARDLYWAEPDIEDGVAKLQRLAEEPALRSTLARRGGESVKALGDAWTREALRESLKDVTAMERPSSD
jgi:glycosyltransferase involved in cell wall biosynthesis